MPRLSAPRLILLAFAGFILLGTVLLKLPLSHYGGISWLDAFFESASAVTVTGLQVVTPANDFTPFGQGVLVVLIQVGGLGVMTATTAGTLLMGQRLGFRALLVLRQEMESPGSPRNILRLVGQVAVITFVIEAVGVVFLAADFLARGFELLDAIGYAIFHSVSAFCNAGFDIFEQEVAYYASDVVLNLVFVALIIAGGLGFPVLVNLYYYSRIRRLTLHSKLVLIPTAVLVVIGVLSVAALEWTNPATLGGEPLGTKILESLFQGTTPRTGGFATVNYEDLRESTLAIQIVLMFIGVAPASTGGGIKVTTVAIIFLILLSQVRGQEDVSAFGRRIPRSFIARSLSISALTALLVVSGAVALIVSDGLRLLPAVFEVTSALGTVGLSIDDTTKELGVFGKLLIVFMMFVGRLGPITLFLALNARTRPRRYSYPEEEIAVG
ncbi:TrkH family potassium uptake protein [soil metagenome]